MINYLSITTTLITIGFIGRWPFLVGMAILSLLYYYCVLVATFVLLDFYRYAVARYYGQTSRDMRRLGKDILLYSCLTFY